MYLWLQTQSQINGDVVSGRVSGMKCVFKQTDCMSALPAQSGPKLTMSSSGAVNQQGAKLNLEADDGSIV